MGQPVCPTCTAAGQTNFDSNRDPHHPTSTLRGARAIFHLPARLEKDACWAELELPYFLFGRGGAFLRFFGICPTFHRLLSELLEALFFFQILSAFVA